MAPITYGLCALVALLCALLLLAAWRRNGHRLLLWSGLCFAGFTLNNALLVIDKVVYPNSIDLTLWRASVALLSVMVLLYGLVWDAE
jgi:cytochrome bd-type quinol oxidase subunit 2